MHSRKSWVDHLPVGAWNSSCWLEVQRESNATRHTQTQTQTQTQTHIHTHTHTHTPVHELQCLTRVQSRDSRLGLPACDQKRWTLRKWCDGIHWWPPHVTSSSRPPSRVGDVDATLPPDAAGQRAQEWFRVGRASRLTITATIARPASIVTLGIGAAGCGPEALVTAIFIFLVTVSWPGVMIRRLFKLAAQHTILQKATQHV